MPYLVRKSDKNTWTVYKINPDKSLTKVQGGDHPNAIAARRHQKALYANVKDA